MSVKLNEVIIGDCVTLTNGNTGYVKEIKSKKDTKKGIKVTLTNNIEGYIQSVESKAYFEKQQFKLFNEFFNSKYIFVLQKDAKVFNLNDTNACFLFASKEKAQELDDVYLNKPYSLMSIKNNDVGVKKLNEFDFFIINNKVKISKKNYINKSEYFKMNN